MTCRFYNASDFEELLDDLCTEDNTEVIESSNKMNLKFLSTHKEGNKKAKVFAYDGGTIEFEATFPIPKVIQTDIRRSYGLMFINAVNSGELPLLYGFLDTFLAPNAKQITRKLVKSVVDDVHGSQQRGVISIAKCWFTRLQMAPDTVLGIKDVKIVSNSDNDGTLLLSKFSIKATKILGESSHGHCHNHSENISSDPICNLICQICYHFLNNEHIHEESLPLLANTSGKRPMICDEDKHLQTIAEIQSNVSKLIGSLNASSEVVELEVDGDLIFHIDSSMRITKVELTFDM